MRKATRKICVKCGQRSGNRKISFHHFPRPGRPGGPHEDKAQKWAQFAFPNENWDDNEALKTLAKKNRCLCSHHFFPRDFNEHGRLKPEAIPSLKPRRTKVFNYPFPLPFVFSNADFLLGRGNTFVSDSTKSESIISDTVSSDPLPQKRSRTEPPPTTSQTTSGQSVNPSEAVENSSQDHSIFPCDSSNDHQQIEVEQTSDHVVSDSSSCDSNHSNHSESNNSDFQQSVHSKYEFVDCWPGETRNNVPTVTSLDSGNINIISTTDGNFLIDCGLNCKSSSTSTPELFSNDFVVKEETILNPELCIEDLWGDLEQIMKAKNAYESKYVESYLSKIDFALLSNFFKAIIITSRDEDRWNLLPYLLLNQDGSRNSAYQIEALIFHGNPIGYSKTFVKFLRHFLKVRGTTKVYFCSLENSINEEDYVNILANRSMLVQQKMFLSRILDSGNTYINTLMKPSYLPFESHLSLLKSKVRVIFPLINRHHDIGPNGNCKLLKETLPSSFDAAIVGVIMAREALPLSEDNFSMLFLGNSSIDTQDLMKGSLEAVCLNQTWDVVLTSCKEINCRSNFSSSFLNYCGPNVVIVPSMDSFLKERIFNCFSSNVRSISSSRLHHRFQSSTGEGGKFVSESTILEQNIFSLHAPLTIRYTEKNAFIRQS